MRTDALSAYADLVRAAARLGEYHQELGCDRCEFRDDGSLAWTSWIEGCRMGEQLLRMQIALESIKTDSVTV